MIVVKVVNQRVVQVALAGPNCRGGRQLTSHILSATLATRNSQPALVLRGARALTQSTASNQKITNANNQQLIPIARNISFRRCQLNDCKRSNAETSAQFSISAQSSQFISAEHPFIVFGDEQEIETKSESPLETLKKRAKDIRDKKELAAKNKYYGQSFNEALPTTTSERRLVVLLSWLEAKEKHIEKYRQFYLDRGFDVLNVKTSPLDLLLPNFGARKISQDFVRFMVEKQYSEVVLHGFSVGGYMFGRLLLEIDKHEPETREKLLTSIRGLVFDSLVPFEGICPGVANSITRHPIGSRILEQLLRIYLVLGHRIATKYFIEASEKVWGGPLRCPALFLMSKSDRISDYRIVERLKSVWSELGVDTQALVVDSSPHVQIYSKHRELYTDRVENFLKHIRVA